jgi:Domain of unknown function (DUF4062)
MSDGGPPAACVVARMRPESRPSPSTKTAMPDRQFRVFLSAVTSEFGKVRDALSADLRARGVAVSVQSDFRQEATADTLLAKLHDYIWGCDAVVCIIGNRPGELPPDNAAAPGWSGSSPPADETPRAEPIPTPAPPPNATSPK